MELDLGLSDDKTQNKSTITYGQYVFHGKKNFYITKKETKLIIVENFHTC